MMTYSNKFVMCVLHRGRPQKELSNGVVKLPFNCEYTLRFRNKNNRRAVVKIYIDGENVSGGGYVIRANDYVDIKRHHDKDRAFKFVSLDSPEAYDHGKNGPNPDKVKGTIEARFTLEKERVYHPPVIYRDVHHDHHHHHHHDHWRRPITPDPYPIKPYWTSTSGDNVIHKGGITLGDSELDYSCDSGEMASPAGGTSCSMGDMATSRARNVSRRSTTFGLSSNSLESGPELQDGATVEGHSTGQSFYSTHVDLEETETVLKLFLQGYEGDEVVEVAEERPERPRRRPSKDRHIDDLEAENERLRRELAEKENRELKEKLEDPKE
jgi:hypothetical protein